MAQIKQVERIVDIDDSDKNFDYQENLTRELDCYEENFNEEIINKITLWKVNRYPIIDHITLCKLNKIKKDDKSFDTKEIKELIIELLKCKGVQLPMASTYLRFKNPSLFQIIDQRVYRVLYGKELNVPSNTEKNREKISDLYLKYLRDLKKKCKFLKIDFKNSDRILYKFDKRINKEISLKNY